MAAERLAYVIFTVNWNKLVCIVNLLFVLFNEIYADIFHVFEISWSHASSLKIYCSFHPSTYFL